jgi:nitroreductase
MENDVLLEAMLTRRSVSPKRLALPAPSREALNSIIGAGLRAPDHGGLLPWRVIEFPIESRPALADVFAAEKLRRDPVASTDDIARAREHATKAPAVLAFVVRPERHPLVPIHEQWLGAGAALGNMLTAAHLLGFGAIVLSGERCEDPSSAPQSEFAPRRSWPVSSASARSPKCLRSSPDQRGSASGRAGRHGRNGRSPWKVGRRQSRPDDLGLGRDGVREAGLSRRSWSREPAGRGLLKWAVAAIWALIVGLLMAGGGALLGLAGSDLAPVSVLGGLGAAAYIVLYEAGR